MSAVDMFYAAPPVTRTLTALTLLISISFYANLIPGSWIFFHHSYLWRFPPQLWRLATCFMLTGEKLSILMDPYYLYTYGSKCENGSSKFTKPGDFFTYLVYVCVALLLVTVPENEGEYPFAAAVPSFAKYLGAVVVVGMGINHVFFGSAFILTSALIAAFAYTATQDEGGNTRIFILDIPTRAVPLMMCFMTFLMTHSVQAAMVQATGIVAAHLYDFLTRLYPEFGAGPNILSTPAFVRRWFSREEPSVSQKSYGTSYQAGTPHATASGTEAGSVLPEAWKSRGSGHRLGSD